jgi:hypothetical protein
MLCWLFDPLDDRVLMGGRKGFFRKRLILEESLML